MDARKARMLETAQTSSDRAERRFSFVCELSLFIIDESGLLPNWRFYGFK
jgi:hypothetical protein